LSSKQQSYLYEMYINGEKFYSTLGKATRIQLIATQQMGTHYKEWKIKHKPFVVI